MSDKASVCPFSGRTATTGECKRESIPDGVCPVTGQSQGDPIEGVCPVSGKKPEAPIVNGVCPVSGKGRPVEEGVCPVTGQSSGTCERDTDQEGVCPVSGKSVEPTEDDSSDEEQQYHVPDKTFTLAELRQHNGQGDRKLYLALNGKVFDVEKGRSFYGPGGAYEVFAGRDASRGLATGSLEEEAISEEYDHLDDLTDSQLDSMRNWEKTFAGKYEIVGTLLEGGDEVVGPPPSDITFAAREGNFEYFCKYYNENEIDLNKMDDKGCALIHHIAHGGSMEILEFAVKHGIDVHLLNLATHESAIGIAANRGFGDVVDYLIEHKVDFKKADCMGATPYVSACANGHIDIVKSLLDAGVELSSSDRENWTGLHWAAGKGHTELCRVLIDRGADINAKEAHDNTPLYWAGFSGHQEAYELLLELGADPTIPNIRGELAELKESGENCSIM